MKYHQIFFDQGEAATELLSLLDKKGPKKTLDAIAEFVDLNSGEVCDDKPWGADDELHPIKGGYYLAANYRLGYISLTKAVKD